MCVILNLLIGCRLIYESELICTGQAIFIALELYSPPRTEAFVHAHSTHLHKRRIQLSPLITYLQAFMFSDVVGPFPPALNDDKNITAIYTILVV